MPSRAARQATRRRTTPDPIARPRRSRTLLAWLVGSSVLILGTLVCLFFADVKLGQGYFATLWSPLADERLLRTMPLLIFGAMACGAAWSLAQRDRVHLFTGRALAVLALVGGSVWVWYAPPEPLHQQVFNMSSLSTDGAFVFEAKDVASLPDYLRQFPTVTLAASVEQKGGTRVLSNPPLTTAIAVAFRRALANEDPDRPGFIERRMIERWEVVPLHAVQLAQQFRMSIVFTAIWMLGGFAAYALGRLFLSPAGSVVFATIVTFNPCTVSFVPGKDPGQLLTINLMLWAWFAAWQRRSMSLAALGGAILTVGATAGLVHIWVALIAAVATLWHAWRERSVRTVALNAAAAAVGGVIVCAAAQFMLGWNIPQTLLGVSRRWTQLQATFDMNRGVWYAIGLPIFLLFVGAGTWALLGLNLRRVLRRRVPWGFGARLTLCTLAVMALIYGPLGVTYELPRLWIAFLPPLMLGLCIDLPLLRCAARVPSRAAIALALILAVHIGFTAVHWSLFDARESELRLMSNRFYG